MLFKLAWSILGTRGFKFIQIKSIGLQIATTPERDQKGEKFLKSSSSEPVDKMQKYLAWIISMTCAALVPRVTHSPTLKSLVLHRLYIS